MPIINTLFLIANLLILYRLLTTNHWTTGKKFLVAMCLSLMWQQGVVISGILGIINVGIVTLSAIANAPMTLSMIGLIVFTQYLDD